MSLKFSCLSNETRETREAFVQAAIIFDQTPISCHKVVSFLSMKVIQLMPLLLLLTFPFIVENVSQGEISKIKSGMQFAENLTGQLSSSGFVKFLNTAAKSAISYVSTTISFLGLVLSFLGSNESRELLEIKRMYNEMNRRFDLIDIELDKLKKEINWSQVKLQYSSIEQTILTNSKLLKAIYQNPLQIKNSEKDYFIHSFENNGLQTTYQLYLGLIGQGLTLNNDLLHVAMVSFEYDRPKTQQFMLGILKLFVDGVITELAYRKYKYGDAEYAFHREEWASRIHNVTEKIMTIDKLIRRNYYVQSQKDIDRFSKKNPKAIMNSTVFSHDIYSFLVQKYDWRDWLVIVYEPISGDNKHYNHFCSNGFKRYGVFGRNIAVASVDQMQKHIDKSGDETFIRRVSTSIPKMCDDCAYMNYCVPWPCPKLLNAKEVFDKIPSSKKDCNGYQSVGVIRSGNDICYQGLRNRVLYENTPGSNSYSIYFFG